MKLFRFVNSDRPSPLKPFLLAILIVLFPRFIKGNSQVKPEPNESSSSESQSVDEILEPWAFLLVDEDHPLPNSFSVSLLKVEGEFRVDERIAKSLEKLFLRAREQKVSLILTAAYRSENEQQLVYDQKIDALIKEGMTKSQAEQQAAFMGLKPGVSEHHTGLAVDFATERPVDGDFGESNAFRWLESSAAQYGFILRYPPGKEEITGHAADYTHYRYVGRDAAKKMKKQGLCLEEYLQNNEIKP